MHGEIETVGLDEDDWLFVWISAILLEAGSDRIQLDEWWGSGMMVERGGLNE